ncbi:DNA polymerase epsilon subunit 4 [Brachionus plicatilis]|uniref:DNA polymerase epsilon subunit 4 n=1 Tax=Brachionus plicatilis TaxID=10195 RepID=A0A3M7T3T3_BRAPC|nr:DNA polymerase epsilon subunit 4 [Brachionus plicatilis]
MEESQMVQNLNEIESSIDINTNEKFISQLVNDVTQVPSSNDKLISQMINEITETPKGTLVPSTNDKLISQMINDISDTPIRDISNEDEAEKESKKTKKADLELDFTTRPCQLALSRIKTIMKLDPELNLTSKDSVFLIAKATELFIEFLSKEAYKFTSQGARKTIQRKDIDQAVNSVDSLCFLDAALD